MTDLEMTKLCAEAMFLKIDRPIESRGNLYLCYHPLEAPLPLYHKYAPLDDDAQAMALVKKMNLTIYPPGGMENEAWNVFYYDDFNSPSDSINRAIVECVAKMQAAKQRA